MTLQELKEFHQIINDKFNGKGNFESIDIENALEKQIPKKLKTIVVGRFGLVLLCPSCENEIAMIWESVLQKGKYKQNYCDNCGQALDWSENSD